MWSKKRSEPAPAGRLARLYRRFRDAMPATDSRPGACDARPAEQALRGWIVVAVAAVAFLGTISSPPSLLDDVDATYAQIARTMLESGEWVTARLNGVPYFDKPPGQVWAMALSFSVFGTSDWAARAPMALAAIALCWLAWRMGRWAFGNEAGLYAGLGLATCCGLFLFTRARMPDVYVACSSVVVLQCFLRAQEGGRGAARARMRWAGAAVGVGLLFKGLVAAVLPLGAISFYLLASGIWRSRETWQRLNVGGAATVAALVAAPWHLLAAVANPPVLEFSLDSGPGQYRGFLWRYFINEHVLRFLGMRHPMDYDRVPLLWFWIGHLAWLFPWSGLLPAVRRLSFHVGDRAGRTRLLMLCHCGFTLLFFSASTSQEYYTLPAYAPAMVLLASAAAARPAWISRAVRTAAAVYAAAFAAGGAALVAVWNSAAEGDISAALTSNPEAYTLSLGHFQDLTLGTLAYLRGPLSLALAAFLIGAAAGWVRTRPAALATIACAATILLHAAHWAMARFDPHLSSRAVAEAYLREVPGRLVLDQEYYAFSSVVFYTNQDVLLLNGRKNNIEYGSHAPGAPDVFLDDAGLVSLWKGTVPTYVVTYARERDRFITLLGSDAVRTIARSGGKVLLASASPGADTTASPLPQASGRESAALY